MKKRIKNIRKKRLKAFTLLELLATLAISGMVVSIAAMCFNILLNRFTDFKSKSKQILSAAELREVIGFDFFAAQKVVNASDGFVLEGADHAPLITYVFNTLV